ncbi:hypothetical protein L1987_36612 [Smallanthus sonchifolius]|uniref:Uncharacterized protein n=1 Tax=Smallanthus sonchifolius TaxID=185202 RepID=A0ACB9HDN4_9ASTR|nr:hypothetical protein L1987_36612 [Smallanthus sonchifolius]
MADNWVAIASVDKELEKDGVSINNIMQKLIGDGKEFSFWNLACKRLRVKLNTDTYYIVRESRGVHVPQPHDIRFKCVCSTRNLGFRKPSGFQLR